MEEAVAEALALGAGMLAVCCAIATCPGANFSRLSQLSIDHAVDCAPFSSLLLGLLCEKAGRLMGFPPFGHLFVPLLRSERADVRASAAFLLGVTRDPTFVAPLMDAAGDASPTVRARVLLAVTALMNIAPDQEVLARLGGLRGEDPVPRNSLVQILLQSVKQAGFRERYSRNVFDVPAASSP